MVRRLLYSSLKTDKVSGGSVSLQHATQLAYIFQHGYLIFVIILLRLLAGLSLNLRVCKRAVIAEFTTQIRLIELTIGRMPIVTGWRRANTFHEVFARLSIELPRWTPASEVLFPRRTSTSFVLVAQMVERFSSGSRTAHGRCPSAPGCEHLPCILLGRIPG